MLKEINQVQRQILNDFTVVTFSDAENRMGIAKVQGWRAGDTLVKIPNFR